MSFCRKEGKDTIIFATEEDHSVPSKVKLPDPEPAPGLLLSDGSINWNCPCLGGMATGPCGVQFRDAFSCFHYSKEEPKGGECFDAFREMQTCMAKYPSLYNNPDDDDDFGPDFDSDKVEISKVHDKAQSADSSTKTELKSGKNDDSSKKTK